MCCHLWQPVFLNLVKQLHRQFQLPICLTQKETKCKSNEAECRQEIFKRCKSKVRCVHSLIITQKADLDTLNDSLASFINKARESFGRAQNSKSVAEGSPLTIPSLICLSLCHPQSKQMTWAAWDTGVSNSDLVFLKEEMWQIFRCWNCLKC